MSTRNVWLMSDEQLLLKLKAYEIKWVYHPVRPWVIVAWCGKKVKSKVLNDYFFGLLLVCWGSIRSFDFLHIFNLDRLSEVLGNKALKSIVCHSGFNVRVVLVPQWCSQRTNKSIILKNTSLWCSKRSPWSFPTSGGMPLKSVIICRSFKVKRSCQSC